LANSEFASLIERVRCGDQDAAWTLIDRYSPHILAVVRRSLNRSLRSKFDSVDFVQAVWASFFRQSPLEKISDPDQFIRFLAGIARHKVLGQYRHHVTVPKRVLGAEIRMADPNRDDPTISRDPTPSTAAAAREIWKQLVERESPLHQEIIRLRLGGTSYVEIAKTLSINERTARRVVDRLLAEQVA